MQLWKIQPPKRAGEKHHAHVRCDTASKKGENVMAGTVQGVKASGANFAVGAETSGLH